MKIFFSSIIFEDATFIGYYSSVIFLIFNESFNKSNFSSAPLKPTIIVSLWDSNYPFSELFSDAIKSPKSLTSSKSSSSSSNKDSIIDSASYYSSSVSMS